MLRRLARTTPTRWLRRPGSPRFRSVPIQRPDLLRRPCGQVRTGLNQVIASLGRSGLCLGRELGLPRRAWRERDQPEPADLHTPEGVSTEFLKASGGNTLGMAFEIGMLLEGVHVFHSGGLLSTRHTDADVEHTVALPKRSSPP